MSRIDAALRRLTGATAESRPPAMLDRFAPEKVKRLDETKVAPFIAAASPAVEGKPSISSEASAPPAKVAHQRQFNLAAEPRTDPKLVPGLEVGVDTEKLVDVRQIIDYAGFLAGSLRRHKALASGAFLLTLAMTAAAALLVPRTYHAQAKLLAQRNAMMAALSNPGRAVPWDADAPTRAAAETVLRRDNVISLIRQTNLMEEWVRTRVPILKLKDWLMASVLRRRPSPDEQLDQLVGLINARMVVVAGPVGDGTVTIDLDWPDAQMAYRLVQSAQQMFIEARQVAETAAINDSIALLERYSATLHEDLDRTLADLQRAQGRPTPKVSAIPPRAAVASSGRVPATVAPLATLAAIGRDASVEPDPELARLNTAVSLKKLEIAKLEETRQRQVAELETRLGQLVGVYTPVHPSVISVQKNIDALSHESPQVVALKADLVRLEAEYETRAVAAEDLQIKASLARRAAVASPQDPVFSPPGEARTPQPVPTERPGGRDVPEFASLRMRSELNQLESVLERTDGARIELAVSQAAFKYRYTVIQPAQVPRSPVRPNIPMIMVAGLIASFVVALAAVVGKDLMSSRILEPWQIERQLGLSVLGTLVNV